MKLRRISPALAVLLLAVTPAIAQKVDFARQGPAGPPVIDASEDYPLNYLGGEPSLFTAALDADDSTYTGPSVAPACPASVPRWPTTPSRSPTTPPDGQLRRLLQHGRRRGVRGNTGHLLTLYDTSFNPAAPLTNCLAVNDDINGASDRCSTLTFAIPLGQTGSWS